MVHKLDFGNSKCFHSFHKVWSNFDLFFHSVITQTAKMFCLTNFPEDGKAIRAIFWWYDPPGFSLHWTQMCFSERKLNALSREILLSHSRCSSFLTNYVRINFGGMLKGWLLSLIPRSTQLQFWRMKLRDFYFYKLPDGPVHNLVGGLQ